MDKIKDFIKTFKDFYDIISGYVTIAMFIWSIFQYLYYNKMRFYIFITKLFRKWKDTEWELTFTYDVEENEDIFSVIENVIKDIYNIKNVKKEMNLSNSKIYSLRNFLLKVSVDEYLNEKYKEVFIEIPKLKTTYNHAKELLNEIDLLSNRISRNLNTKNEIYTIKIKFKNGENPFLGFMLQRLGVNNINSFRCEINSNIFTKTTNNELYNQKAQINKDYISITQKNFFDLKEIASNLLLLK